MARRWAINITPAERGARIVVGALAAAAGLYLLTRTPSTATAILEVLLVIAGLDLVATGALGHCPLYQRLGHMPATLKGRS